MLRKPKSNAKSLENRKPQLRALRTRKQLIDAARRVFARDGFELARLADISATAGKTRGAFYDHFKNKEDVFFAIMEEDLLHYFRWVSEEFRDARTTEDRIDALSRHLFRVLEDRRRMMLFLEFKIYAIRHPRRTRRLAEIQSEMCLRGIETILEPRMPELRSRTPGIRRMHNVRLGAILDGLFINRLFNAASLNHDQTMQFIRFTVRAMLQQGPPPVNHRI
ncbi:MAG TPA: TetR family transcriptional regulator [Candidatus Acidoferrum sp.]|jgi:AcrR family transcriptional regulator